MIELLPAGITYAPSIAAMLAVADYLVLAAPYSAETHHIINREAIWFFTFQNTYYAVTNNKLKGLPPLYSGVIDVSDTWLE